ncbi:MAG: endolytic transglycosylase MltG [bacterium]|nr:endolytic transglycosylase MltG [bacterium]
MRKLLFVPLLIILAVISLLIWWNVNSREVNDKDNTAQPFLITRGQSASVIAKNLEKQGLIRSNSVFRLYLEVTGNAEKIQAGEYTLSPNLNLRAIASLLLSGPQELWVTYPEGIRREEIALRTISTLGLKGDQAQIFWDEFIVSSEDHEGYLFPDTYLFARDISALKVVNKLKSTFKVKTTEVKSGSLTLEQIVNLASIVERETITDEEKPIVAGILTNRLNIGMALQADATLQYVTGTRRCGGQTLVEMLSCQWWVPPTVQDKEIVSSYSTYGRRGLPQGPIGNPGLKSIEAAANSTDSPYLYYLHDAAGKIHYARTLDEHNENITKYLR